jgi:hypothetical protein
MGAIVDVVEEIRDRLATAQASGDLTEFVAVRVGALDHARAMSDFPLINLRLLRGEDEAVHIQRGFTSQITIEVRLIIAKLSDINTDNQLYKTSDSTGALFLIEKVFNVIEKNTSGTVDLNFNTTSRSLLNYSYDFNETDSSFEIPIELTIETAAFQAGSR